MAPENRIQDKQLNFYQPLLSVRRGSGSSTATPAQADRKQPVNPSPCLPPLPYYKSDLKSGPVTNPGSIPFHWEKTPGRAKDERKTLKKPPLSTPSPPPGRVLNEYENSPDKLSDSDGESSTYMDALDSLSRSGSFSLNCSLSGVSGLDSPRMRSSGTFLDPQARDFMMDRFLPAAKAVASETPHFGSRKQHFVKEQPREVKKAIMYHTQTNLPQHREDEQEEEEIDTEEGEDDDDDDDNELGGAEIASNRLCGLLPRFCLLNPLPGMKDQASIHKKQSNSSVYKKSEKAIRNAISERRRLAVHQRSDLEDELRKIKSPNASLKLDELLKIATLESSNIAPFRSVSRHSLMDKDKGFLGLPEPVKHAGSTKVNPQAKGFKIFRELLADDTTDDDEPPPANPTLEEHQYPNSTSLEIEKLSESRKSWQNAELLQLTWKENDDKLAMVDKTPLRSPPLPKSPSESWLSRALPSMHSRHPCQKTNPIRKNPGLSTSAGEGKWEAVVKCSTLHSNNSGIPALMPITENQQMVKQIGCERRFPMGL